MRTRSLVLAEQRRMPQVKWGPGSRVGRKEETEPNTEECQASFEGRA